VTDENEQDRPDLEHGEPAETPPPQPTFVPMPPPMEAEPAAVPAPTAVTVSFWIWIAGAALSVVGAILTVANRGALLASLHKNPPAGVKPDQYESLVNASVTTSVIVAVVFAGLYVFFAYKIKAGRTWARTTLTALTVLSVLFNLFFGASVSTYISVLVAVVAVGLLYTPNARMFFAAARTRL
jgi:hypothetical protein